MNFLAHIYLSGDNDLIKIGNFMADGVRGNKYLNYPEEIQKGMMGRDSLDGCMVFKMKVGYHSFWMKNCIVPLDVIFIENGKITTPIKTSVVTGNVFETLQLVDAVSEEFQLLSFVGGGCGKMEQYPLPVGFGGPYTLVRKLNVM